MNPDEAVLRVVSVSADGSVELSSGSLLTPREIELLQQLAQGKSNREVADALYLSVNTVEYYATRLYQKLSVRNRTQAVMVAASLGLLDLPSTASPDSTTLEAQKPISRNPELSRAPAPRSLPGIQSRRYQVLRTLRSFFIKSRKLRVVASVLVAAVVLSWAAVATAAAFEIELNLDQRWSRYKQHLFGYPPSLHCYTPGASQHTGTPWQPREAPEVIELEFFGQKVVAEPGTLCFKSPSDLFVHYGRDPKQPYCVVTEPAPRSLREVEAVPFEVPVPAAGAACFPSMVEAFRHFGFDVAGSY